MRIIKAKHFKMQKLRECFIKDISLNHTSFYGKVSAPSYFNGPTLYFHLASLNSRHCPSLFASTSYAMLACWGMHRMGPKGPKMTDFSIYEKSLNDIWPDIRELQGQSLESMDDKQWEKLKKCFFRLDIMVGDSIIVGHSKVLAHLLPNTVPPIDRTHTLKFLGIAIAPKESKIAQWVKFRDILEYFFLPVLQSASFQNYYRSGKLLNHPLATSPLKSIDNLIIGADKSKNYRTQNEHH